MTKDEALKIAIEALKNTKFPVGDKRNEAINACKEALEQPLTRDWKDTIDERIARDSEFKEALEQPAQECKWCKSREVNFDDWGDEASEKRQDVVGQNGNVGYGESVDG